jgi:hypothetical protein
VTCAAVFLVPIMGFSVVAVSILLYMFMDWVVELPTRKLRSAGQKTIPESKPPVIRSDSTSVDYDEIAPYEPPKVEWRQRF